MAETKMRGLGKLYADRLVLPVSYTFWIRDGSNYVGNGVLTGNIPDLMMASRKAKLQLELADGVRRKIWISEIRPASNEASFLSE